MDTTPLERLLRRASPDVVARSYLAKFLVVVLLVLAAIGAVGAVTYAETTDHLEANAQADYTAVAELSGTELDGWASERRSMAGDIADSDAFSRDKTQVSSYLASHHSRTADEVVALHYVDRKAGTVIASSEDGDDAGAAVTGQEWFDENLLFGDQVYTTPTYEVDGQRRVAYVAATPLREYVVMEIDLDPSSATSVSRPPGPSQRSSRLTGRSARATVPASPANATARTASRPVRRGAVGRPHAIGVVSIRRWRRRKCGVLRRIRTGPVRGLVRGGSRAAVRGVRPLGDDRAKPVAHHRRRSRGLGLLGVTLGRGTVIELNRLTGKARALESGDLDVAFDTDRRDEFGDLYGAFSTMRDSLGDQIESAETQRKRAEAAKAESEAFAETLETRAAAFGATMAACADGDLTARLDANADDPAALREIADGFNDAMDELEVAIARVDRFAEEVTNKSEAVTDGADEVAAAGQETSEAVDEISAGAQRQSRQLSDVAGEMEDMSATVEEVAASADEVATTSQRARAHGRRADSRGRSGRGASRDRGPLGVRR